MTTKKQTPEPVLHKTDGSSHIVSNWPEKSKERLALAQKLIGGYVEIVHRDGEYLYLGDEEGLLKNLPQNPLFLTRVVGNVLQLKESQFS